MKNDLGQAIVDMFHFDPDKSNCKGDKKQWEFISEFGMTKPKELPEICEGCRYIMSCMSEQTQYLLDNPEDDPDFQALLEAVELLDMNTSPTKH